MHVHRAPNVCRWVYLLYSLDVWVHKQSLLSFTHLPLFVGFYIWRFNLYNKKVFLAIIILSILYFFFFSFENKYLYLFKQLAIPSYSCDFAGAYIIYFFIKISKCTI